MLWLLSFKIIALWLGPSGVAVFSQLRQILQAATIASTFGGTNSVVQGISERHYESARLAFRATVSRLIAVCSIAVSLLMLLFAPGFSQFFFSANSADLTWAIRWIGFAVLFNSAATYMLGVLNGYRSYLQLALAQLAGPTVLVTVLLGAFIRGGASVGPQLLGIAFVLCFGATFAAGAWGVNRLSASAAVKDHRDGLSAAETGQFLKFAVSNLGAALATTLTFLIIRTWIIDARGLDFAGLFDAGWTLTFNYATIFLTACSSIYLPLLTRTRGLEEQRKCILKTAYLVFAGALLVCYYLVLFSGPIVRILYSAAFHPSEEVLSILVIAVIFRSISWVYGSLIVATKKSRILLFSDVAFNLGLLSATKYALDYHASLASLAWAFVALNFCYLMFAVEYVRRVNRLMFAKSIWPLTIWGVGPLVFLATTMPSSPVAWGWIHWILFVSGIAAAFKSLLDFKRIEL